MDHPIAADSASRFEAYVEGLVSVIGHADRARPLRDYCVGLMMPCERKSVEPMAAVTAPERTAAQHQSLLHFVGEGRWSDEKVLAKVREMVLPEIVRHGQIKAWIIDDTGFQTGPAFGRSGTAVLWSTRQAGQFVRSRCRYRLPIVTPACRWRIACICRNSGRRTMNAGARQACPRISASGPSPRSRSSRSARPVQPGCRSVWC